MVSLVVRQDSYRYSVVEEENPAVILFTVYKEKILFFPDRMYVYNADGSRRYFVKYPELFERTYKLYDAADKVCGKIIFDELTIGGDRYSLNNFWRKKELLKNAVVVGSFVENRSRTTYTSEHLLTGLDRNDLENFALVFILRHLWSPPE